MTLKEIKLKPFDSQSQAILFNEKGIVLDTDNTLFRFVNDKSNVFQDIDLLQGMEEIVKSSSETNPLKFNCVNTTIDGYQSHFDFIIQPAEKDNEYYLLVYDFAEQYQRVFELQQERNVRDIESNKLERENKKIKEENEVINRLYNQMGQSGSNEYVLLRSDNVWVNVDFNNVNYFEAYGDYIKVHTDEKMYIIHYRMKNLEEQLPAGRFARIHRSFIVQTSKINNIEQMSLDIGGKIVPIGKQYKQDLLNQMNPLN